MDTESERFSIDYWHFKNLNGVVIIPIKHQPPVLIFKDFSAAFYSELPSNSLKPEGQKTEHNNFMVYWKGKYLNHMLPKIVQKQYGDFFHKIIQDSIPTYIYQDSFPKDSIELPISIFKNKRIPIDGPKYLTDTKTILRKLEFLNDGRKNPRANHATQMRNNYLIKCLKDLGWKKGRFPLKEIKIRLANYLEKNIPENEFNKYDLSESQIQRILAEYRDRPKKQIEFYAEMGLLDDDHPVYLSDLLKL